VNFSNELLFGMSSFNTKKHRKFCRQMLKAGLHLPNGWLIDLLIGKNRQICRERFPVLIVGNKSKRAVFDIEVLQ
jgi:hypothetical protein